MLERLAERTRDSIGELRDVIAMTGLDADRLLAKVGAAGGLGGPFIEAGIDGDEGSTEIQLATLNSHIDQWGDLQQVLRRLPLAAPLDDYVTRSPFGKRKDPINGKWAKHSGLDLGAPPKTKVHSTAPGIVVFAGTHPSYGRMVEIDHGMGVRTRYGHLNSFSVRKGQTVAYRQPIGVIGNSGRSTGIHLHYEVLVNDSPQDPMRFIQAGKHVFKG
jgi:murein DD-endopeptidase MepM/ murein hydrolase activator NlpD